MVISTSLFHSPVSFKYDRSGVATKSRCMTRINQKFTFPVNGVSPGRTRWDSVIGSQQSREWSFIAGSKISLRPRFKKLICNRSSLGVYASWWISSQIASNVFTLGTVAVLPFYTLMVLAPKAKLTRKSMESSVPYIVLGLLYGYLLYLSWTPETIQLMFASKYWLPELSGIAKMFSNEMTLASAWIHLLAVDLFAARQVYHDGLKTQVETRHSVSLCLLFCPLGIVTHFITKELTKKARNTEQIL